MPIYDVIEKGFHNGTLYKPGHPRHGTLTTERPLKPVPSWLGLRKANAPRRATEKAEPAVDQKVETDAVTFVEEPSLSGPDVQTLG